MGAANRGNLHLVKLLVAKGANVNAVDLRGHTALHNTLLDMRVFTARTGVHKIETLRYLLEHGAEIDRDCHSLFGIALLTGNVEAAHLFLEHGEDPCAKSRFG